jgi:hypothetical protein
MKSRALPEEFPILQTLQYPRGVLGTPIPSPTDYHIRRHDVGVGLGNGSSVNVSPTTPSYGFSLAGQNSNSELSPVSTSADRNGYMTGYMTAPQHQRGNPFSRSHTQTDYRNPGSVPRLQLQEDRYGGHEEYQQHSAGYGLFGSANEPPRSVPPEQGGGYAPGTTFLSSLSSLSLTNNDSDRTLPALSFSSSQLSSSYATHYAPQPQGVISPASYTVRVQVQHGTTPSFDASYRRFPTGIFNPANECAS